MQKTILTFATVRKSDLSINIYLSEIDEGDMRLIELSQNMI
jgi:hypothetical protein